MFLIYYTVLSLVFGLGSAVFDSAGYNTTIDLNDSTITDSEVDTGGLFGTGVSFGRYVAFVGFGIGLPTDDTPTWFSVIFFLWQSLVTILFISWLISSIWDG